ncbi:MAG: ATP-binding protein [Spongiibacteraceae bacterium]|jgi:uncharacterized protein|nr:ATP-binding protein [Spongiibacteraceae bacterium]
MPRKIFKRYMPNPDSIKGHPSVRWLGPMIHAPNLWHLNRRSVTLAFFIGVFTAFMPLPGQMVIAALAAILVSANLPLSVCLVWITNPVTMPAFFFVAYKLGAILLDIPPSGFSFELSWHWIDTVLIKKWQPFLLGCTLMGLFFGLLSAVTVHVLWRIHTIHRWRKRQHERAKRKQD